MNKPAIHSMTGFASTKGAGEGFSWAWDIRSVNARGLDARLRLPDWIEGLETALRPIVKKAAERGNINLTLKVLRDDRDQTLAVDPVALKGVLAAVQQVEDSAFAEHGIKLALTSAAEILNMRTITDGTPAEMNTRKLVKLLCHDIDKLLYNFNSMRQAEGRVLATIIHEQLDQITELTIAAAKATEMRRVKAKLALHKKLALIVENVDGADPDRVAQELAIIAVKADVTEEIDRLKIHVKSARDLLKAAGPVGRKLDFLSQEFNREANTLCSKAQSSDLTRIGLDLKAVIDQMREQVQNVE